MKYIYIYNYKQAEFFIKQGARLINIDLNKKTNKLFFKFVRDSEFQTIFSGWSKKK